MTKVLSSADDLYANSEDVIDIDVAFRVFSSGSSKGSNSDYLGVDFIENLRNIIINNRYKNLYSNYSPHIIFVITLVGVGVFLYFKDLQIYISVVLVVAILFCVAIRVQFRRQMPSDERLIDFASLSKRGAASALIEFNRMLV